MSKLYIENKVKDEITNRLTMAAGIIGDYMEIRLDAGCDGLWGALQLIKDANYLFEDREFKGNAKLRKDGGD